MAGKPTPRAPAQRPASQPAPPIAAAPRVDVDPPIPAPYLAAGTPAVLAAPQLSAPLSYAHPLSIPDCQLDKQPRLRLEMQKQVRDAARAIRRRRGDYERERGVVIIPEKVTEPEP